MLKASGTERYYFAGTVLDGETVVVVDLQCSIVRIAANVAEKLRSILFNLCFQFVTISSDTIALDNSPIIIDIDFGVSSFSTTGTVIAS